MVGPRDGPTLLPQNVVKGREGFTCVHCQTQEAPWAQVPREGERGLCQGPIPPDVPFPVVPKHPPMSHRARVAIYKAPETKTEHISHSSLPRWGMAIKRGTGAGPCSEHLTSQVGAGVEPRFPDLYPQQFPAPSEAVSTGPRGNWRKMQSNQLSDVVIIKITTTTISA